MEKCRNCKKDIYFRTNITHSLGLEKERISIYHFHNNSMCCNDGNYTDAERKGKCINCGLVVIQSYNSLLHIFPFFKLFNRCRNPELVRPKFATHDLSKAWRYFTKGLR